MAIYEFYPPRSTSAAETFMEAVNATKEGDTISISMGPGESREADSLWAVRYAVGLGGRRVIGHVSCYGKAREQAIALAEQLVGAGVHAIMALRGMTHMAQTYGGPRYLPYKSTPGGYERTADLVADLASQGVPVVVSGHPEKHPESPSMEDDIRILEDKLAAGATEVFCMFSFRPGAVIGYIGDLRSRGIDVPIHPGIVPVHQALPVLAADNGVDMPDGIRDLLELVVSTDAYVTEVDFFAGAQVLNYRDAGHEPYIYTLNRPETVKHIAALSQVP